MFYKMADQRSQMGFGQMGPQGQNPTDAYQQNQLNMLQQQQYAMMQHQMAAQQQAAAMMQGQHPAMMPAGTMGAMQGQHFTQQQQQQQQQMFQQQQQMMQQQQQQMPMGMYMLQGGQYVQAGFQPGAPMPGTNIVPPAYTPQMAQDYKAKSEKMAARQAKQLAEQQKRFEAEQKVRLFQEQQKKFKVFSAIGGRKMDADSLIKHIIGPDKPKPTVPPTQRPPAKGSPAPVADDDDDDDGFGDFIQGPTSGFTQSAPTSQQPTSQSAPPTHPAPVQPSGGIVAGASNVGPAPQTAPFSTPSQIAARPMSTPSPPQPTPQQEKKDLEKMMFASCDLTAPQKARTFHKRTLVKDAPKQVRQVTYQPSDKARVWAGETEKLSELFTLPAPEPPQQPPQPMPGQEQHVLPLGEAGLPTGQPGVPQPGPPGTPSAGGPVQVALNLPAWCSGELPLPDIYGMVLQAAVRDGKIQTDLVYAILVRSGLPREVLGAIWAMANKTTPGQLLPQELCAVLALIAIAQTSMAMPSVEMLHQLPGPPIPNLGQAGAPQHQQPQDGSTTQPTPTGTTPTTAQGTDMTAGSRVQPAHTPEGTSGGDDFADFQEAARSGGGVPPSDSFGDFTAASPITPSSNLPGSLGGGPSHSKDTSSVLSPEPFMGDEDKYNVFKHMDQAQSPVVSSSVFSDPPTAMSDILTETLPPLQPGKPGMTKAPTQPDVATFMGQEPPNEEFADFASASTSNCFADFQQPPPPAAASSLVIGATPDKLSALKALVADKQLYQEPEKKSELSTKTEDSGDDWTEFSSIRKPVPNATTTEVPSGGAGSVDKYASLSGMDSTSGGHSVLLSKPGGEDLFGGKSASTTKQKELFPADDEETEEWGGFADSETTTNWADFSSPTIPEPNAEKTPDTNRWASSTTKQADWALSSSKNESDLTNFGNLSINKVPSPLAEQNKISKPADPSVVSTKPYSSTTKKYNYFARNLDVIGGGVSAGTGMSPLDFQPPELPDDDKGDEEDQDFDKFGTFHGVDPESNGSSGVGISSLGAPFGGMDDLVGGSTGSVDMFGYSSRPRTHAQPQKDTTDSVSISSNEFTGFKLPSSGGKTTKDQADSQSISSLDLNKATKSSSKDGSPAGGDSQSVSSLEFGVIDRKSVTPADERSIASLELKVVSTPDDAPIDAPRPPQNLDDGFGEFSSATDGPKTGLNGFKPPMPSNNLNTTDAPGKPIVNGIKAAKGNMEYIQRPRAASDLLRQGDLPSIADRYSSLVEKQEDSDRHVAEWERCLDKCRGMLEQAAHSFTSITEPALCEEVLHSRQGTQYIQGIIEIYRVACRITEAMKAASITNEKLVMLLKAIDTAWLDLVTLLSDTRLKPSPGRLDFSQAVLKTEDETAQNRACGVCLLNVDAHGARGISTDHKLTYGGRQYHAACANFWVNCVDSMLPALKIPELL